jgi:hypothetical protein
MHLRRVVAVSCLAIALPLATTSAQNASLEPLPKWSLSLGVDPTNLNLQTRDPGVNARMVANLTRSWQSANSPLTRHVSLMVGRDASRSIHPDEACGCWWKASRSYSALTAGASYDLLRASRFTPYVKAGTGVYHTSHGAEPRDGIILVSQLPFYNSYNSQRGFSLGANGGLGVKVRLWSHELFVEQMIHAFDIRRRDIGISPLNLGFRF